MSEEDVKLATRGLNGFIASKCFMTLKTVKVCQQLQAGLFYGEVNIIFTVHIQKSSKEIKNGYDIFI
jgi:hypothetical protein